MGDEVIWTVPRVYLPSKSRRSTVTALGDRFNDPRSSAKLNQALCEAKEEKKGEVQEANDLSWAEADSRARRLPRNLITKPFSVGVRTPRRRDTIRRSNGATRWCFTLREATRKSLRVCERQHGGYRRHGQEPFKCEGPNLWTTSNTRVTD